MLDHTHEPRETQRHMQLDTLIDVDQFIGEIDAEITDLTDAMRTQTARGAYYGIQHAAAKKQLARVKLTIESVDATLMTKYRKQLEDAAAAEVEGTNKAPTRITVDMVRAAVSTDPNHLKYAQVLIDAEEIETVCKVAYNAFKTREEMLKSLGHIQNAQLKSELRVSANGAKESIGGYAARRAAREQQPQDSQPAG